MQKLRKVKTVLIPPVCFIFFFLNYILEKMSIFVPWGLSHSRSIMKQLQSCSHEDFCPLCLLNCSCISYFFEFVYMLGTSIFFFKCIANIVTHIVACLFNHFTRYFDQWSCEQYSEYKFLILTKLKLSIFLSFNFSFIVLLYRYVLLNFS